MNAKRGPMARRIAEYAFEAEFEAVMAKILDYDARLRDMSDAEFAQAVRDYAEKLIAEMKEPSAGA
jgi:hypothetical protein